MDTIKAIRARRAEMNVPPSKKAEVLVVTATPEVYAQGVHFIQRLAYASGVTFAENAPADVTGMISVVTHNATAYMPLAELVDLAAERERIAKELEIPKEEVVMALESIVDPVSLYEPVYSDGGDTIYVMDQVGDANTDADWVDEMMIKDQIKQLDDRERNIL